MGVKSTITLSRAEAEAKYVDLKLPAAKRALRAEAALLDDKQLEDTIEDLNDRQAGGEGFENYTISGR